MTRLVLCIAATASIGNPLCPLRDATKRRSAFIGLMISPAIWMLQHPRTPQRFPWGHRPTGRPSRPASRALTILQLPVDGMWKCSFTLYLRIAGNLRLWRNMATRRRDGDPYLLGRAPLTRPATAAVAIILRQPALSNLSTRIRERRCAREDPSWSATRQETCGRRLTPRLDRGSDGQSHGSLRVRLGHCLILRRMCWSWGLWPSHPILPIGAAATLISIAAR